jgi:hypothetical protein
MIINPPSSRHAVRVLPLEAHTNWFERLRERGVSALMSPLMFLGTACYILAMWSLERKGEAAH